MTERSAKEPPAGATTPIAKPPAPGQHTTEALTDWGLPDVADLIDCGAAVQA